MTQWNAEIKEAFLKLKAALCQHPVLVALDLSWEFIAQTNAMSEVPEVALLQEVNGEEHAMFFPSRKLLAAKKNYAMVDTKVPGQKKGSRLSAISVWGP